MVRNDIGLHHAHVRKRIHQKHEKYPHPNKFKRFVDKAIYAVGILGPLMTIPQILKIFIEKDASGLAPATWGSYLILSSFWLVYGGMHKEKPIIISSFVWVALEILIIVGIIIY